MTVPDLALAPFHVLLGALSGVLIGCVGIGGVIVVPALVYLLGFPVHTAIAAAMFAFLVSGAVGTAAFARERTIRWDMTAWMWAGAMPAALGGALLAPSLPAGVLEGAIGALAALSGLHALRRSRTEEPATAAAPPNPLLFAVGGFTGFASSLTGTGGPLVLIPILAWLELPTLVAIGLAQAIQLPIAVLATAGNAFTGALDAATGALLGLGIAAGTWGGARLAHALPRHALRRIVAVLLVAVGAGVLIRAAM